MVQFVQPNNIGQAGVRIIPKPVWLLACFFVDPKRKISGPAKDGCIGIVFTAFIFDLPFSFLALVHLLLALIIIPFCGTNRRLSRLGCAAFSFVYLLAYTIWSSACCLIPPTVIPSRQGQSISGGSCMNCISDPAILVLGRFMELSARFGEIGLLGGREIIHTNLDCVFSLATLDRPAANLLEVAATNIRAAETPRFP